MYKTCLVNLHLHYVFWTTTLENGTGHSLFLWLISFLESGVNVHTQNSHLLHCKFPDFFESPRGTLLEPHSTDVFMNGDGVFSGHYLIDSRMALLLVTLLCGSHSSRPNWKGNNTLIFKLMVKRYCSHNQGHFIYYIH